MSVQKKMGNVIIDDSNLTAERTYKGPNWDAYLADSVAVTEAYGSKPALWFAKATGNSVNFTPPSGSIGTGDFCLFAVVKYPVGALGSSNYDYIFSMGDSTNYNMLTMYDVTGQLRWYVSSGTNVTGGPAINDGRIHAIAAVRRSGVLELYVDGQFVASAANTTSFAAFNASQCFIGLTSPTRMAERTLWRVACLNYAPTAQAIARISAGARFDFEYVNGSFANGAVNGGASDTTDWTNAVSGLAQYWGSSTVPGKSIVTGNGFTGNAQRAEYSSNGNDVILYCPATIKQGRKYKMSFKYRSNKAIGIVVGSFAAPLTTFPINTGNAVSTGEFIITADSDSGVKGGPAFGWTSATAGDYIEIDEVQISPLGAVLDYEPEGLTSTLWHDESGNGIDGIVNGAILTNTPHYQNTDYGVAAVLQDVQDNTFNSSKYSLAVSDYVEHANTEPSLAIGDSDATFIITAKIPASRSATLMIISAGSHYLLFRTTTGLLQFQDSDGASSTAALGIYVPTSGGVSTYAAVRYSTNKYRGYLNGVPGPEVSKTRKVPTGSLGWKVGNTTPDSYNGEVSRALFFNYALSEDKIRRYSAGAKLDYDDVGGSMVEKVTNGTFTGNATGWNLSLGFAYNSNNIRATGTQTNANCSQVVQFVRGKRYRLKYNVVTNENLVPITMSGIPFTGNAPTVANQSLDPTVGPHILEFVADFNTGTGNTFQIFAGTADVATNLGSTTGVTLDDISIVQLGACIDLEPENIADSTWVDASPNGLHGTTVGAITSRFAPAPEVRNYLINGGFEFIQRGSYNTEVVGAGFILLDRWYVTGINAGSGPSNIGVKQVGLVPILEGGGNNISLRITDTTTDIVQLYQRIEGYDGMRVCGKNMVLTCWVALGATSPVTGLTKGYKVTANVKYPTAFDNYASTSNGPSVTIYPNLTTTYQRISIPLGQISNSALYGLQVTLEFATVDTSENFAQNGVFQVCFMSLTEGNVPPPLFVRAGRTFAGELALCQRYFQTWAGSSGGVRIEQYGANSIYAAFPLRVPLRANPSLYTNSPVSGTDFDVLSVTGTQQTGFTVAALSSPSSDGFARFRLDKTAHGLTDASVQLLTNKVGVQAEL